MPEKEMNRLFSKWHTNALLGEKASAKPEDLEELGLNQNEIDDLLAFLGGISEIDVDTLAAFTDHYNFVNYQQEPSLPIPEHGLRIQFKETPEARLQ